MCPEYEKIEISQLVAILSEPKALPSIPKNRELKVLELAAGCGKNIKPVSDFFKSNGISIGKYIAMDYLEANKVKAIENGIIEATNFIVDNLINWDYKDNEGKAITGIDFLIIWNTLCYFSFD